MNNIRVKNCDDSLEFLGNHEIKSFEMISGDESNGEAVMRVMIDSGEYEMRVSIKNGKKEGVGLLLRQNGTLFMKWVFVNDECEGKVIKTNEYGRRVLRGRVEKGKEVGMWIEYDDNGNEIWRGFYRNGKRYSILKKQPRKKGLYQELNMNGDLLSVSEYDENCMKNGTCFEYEGGVLKRECVYEHGRMIRVMREFIGGRMKWFNKKGELLYEGEWFGDIIGGFHIRHRMKGMKGFFKETNKKGELLSVSKYSKDEILKNGKCFEYEGGVLKRECIYENGRMIRVIREWNDQGMIEYNNNGMKVYEGGFVGKIKKRFVREGKGTEFGVDGKSAVYVGEWKNGKKEGYGSEFKGYFPVYIGEWKNGLRDGEGEILNENGEVIRRGRWCNGECFLRYEDRYGSDLKVFDTDCVGVEWLEIGDDCFGKVNRFVLDGLNELKSVIIGMRSFYLDENNRASSSCVIMNCDQLSQIHVGDHSFYWYESFELKNLPSLMSIHIESGAFYWCRRVVFDNLIRLQSITLGWQTLFGDKDSVKRNELIMKNLPSLTSFKGGADNCWAMNKVTIENIPSLTDEGIQLIGPFASVRELSCNNDALEYVVTKNGCVTPSKHLLSLHPSVFWISTTQMLQISHSVEHLLIQGCVGRGSKSFELCNYSSLVTLELGYSAFWSSNTILITNLPHLQSIILGCVALAGDENTKESNTLYMQNLPSLSLFKGDGSNLHQIGKVHLINLLALTDDGIQFELSFSEVKELYSMSMID